MSKYILKKKWHPSQVEEVGYVFEETVDTNEIFSQILTDYGFKKNYIPPHQIALLVDAGYLEEYDEAKQVDWAKEMNKLGKEKCTICTETNPHTHSCSNPKPHSHLVAGKTFECEKGVQPTLDLWATEPPKGTVYEFVDSYGNTDWCVYGGNDWDKFRLKTGNCHKTPESAKEALKRLLEK